VNDEQGSCKGRLRAAFLWLETPSAGAALAAIGALGGLLAVIGGALAAHALRGLPDSRGAVIGTAVNYQMYHALALLALAALQRTPAASSWFARAGACFVAGMLLFCGSLWILGLSGDRDLAALAPAGGLLLMSGWVMVFIGALRLGR
jgi:uncharacterized membrane protein YgdD (TMEM256/DUF423 family)